ncbi:MAG: T9SS type A sorting domain-containing protein [Bacteroidetes bacterium]|nr:T9SS type A sorting domain-containing protein [Bacteroidota bacterium]
MKKLLLSFLICSSLLNFAQDWNPFRLGQKSYFMHDNIQGFYSTDTLMNEFCVDSLRDYGSSQTMYFNFTTPNIGNCYSTIISSNFNFLYYFHDNERPDSITVSNSEYTFYFYDYYLTFQNTFVFKPLIQKDSSWIFTYNGNGFNQLKITCDSIFYDTFFGTISDSIKIFSVQALNNGIPVSDVINQDKYFLSKNHGFKSFKNFPLMGIKNNTEQEGFSPPVFEDYYHLNIGDVIIWEEKFSAPPYPGNPPSYIKYYKDSITSVYNNFDTISYGIFRTKNDLTTYNTGSTRYRIIDDVVFSVGTSTLAPKILMPNFGNIDLDEVSPYYINNGVVHKSKINEFKYLDPYGNNCTPTMIMDYGSWENFNTKYGVYQYGNAYMDQSTQWNIIGSTINGIQEGVLWSTLVTGIDNFENTSKVKIYPNPSQSGNFILESEYVDFIELVCIDGKTVFTQIINQPKTELKTGLPKGLYFVKITFENKKQSVQKLIVTD